MSKARLFYCGAATALALAVHAAAYAQSDTSTPGAAVSPGESSDAEIVVTGTNLRGVPPVGSAQISLGEGDFTVAGATSTAQLLQQVPQIANVGISDGSRAQSGGAVNGSYITSINLRNLGANATLTLFDGRRVVPMGLTGIGVDPAAIPTVMLQRVDIVADGASAVYGSDAVAGVVNLIPTRRAEGLRLTVRKGFGEDYGDFLIGAVAGHRWSSGQISLGYEFAHRSNLSGADRDFFSANLSARGGADTRPTTCNPGTIVMGGVTYAIPAGGVTQATAGSLVPGSANICDINKTQDLLPRTRRHSVAFTFDQSIGDTVDVFAQGFYMDRKVLYTPSPQTSLLTVDSTSPFFVRPPGSTADSATIAYALTNVPLNVNDGRTRVGQINYGVRIGLPADFQLSLTGGYGESKDDALTANGVNTFALNAAIQAGTFNPYDPNSVPARSGYNILFSVASRLRLETYEAKIDGTLFALPGGDVAAAVGYQHQILSQHTLNLLGPEGSPSFGSDVGRKIDSFYAELQVPIIGDSNSAAGFHSLTLNAAVRHDKYRDIDAQTTNPKFGINWSPFAGVTLKGSYGTSFRAPNFTEIYGTGVSTFYALPLVDPACGNCLVKSVAYVGPTPNIKPETATTWSVGIDITPEAIPNFRASINYFNVKYDNLITSYLSDFGILRLEQQLAPLGIIVRNPTPAFLASFSCAPFPSCPVRAVVGGVSPDLDNVTIFHDARPANLASQHAQGIDFDVGYRVPTASGEVRIGAAGSYFLSYKTRVVPGAPSIDQLNDIFNPLRFRVRGSLQWQQGGLEAGAFLNYVNSYKNTSRLPAETIGDYATVDLHLAYSFPESGGGGTRGLTIGVDVANLFDRDPPFANLPVSAPPSSFGGGFDSTASNPVGRVISLSLIKKF